MKRVTGLWVDHRNPNGLERVTSQDRRDEQFKNQLSNFYAGVIAGTGAADPIQLFGPGEAKGLDGKALAAPVAGAETVDELADRRQIAAKVRQRLLQRGLDRGRYVERRGMPANAGAAAVKGHRRITHKPE